MQQPEESSGLDRVRNSFNWFTLIVNSIACTVQVFIHSRIGERFVGLHGLVGAAIIFLWTLLFPQDDSRPMMWFLVAYLVMCGWTRTTSLYRKLKGRVGHSRYNGYPRVMRFCPRLNEIKVKRMLEPLLVFGTGVLCVRWSEPLGAYLMASAVALLLSVEAIEMHQRQRAMDLLDNSIDQQGIAERFRELRGDRR